MKAFTTKSFNDVKHGSASSLHLGIVPGTSTARGGVAQYSASVIASLMSDELPADIGSITVLRADGGLQKDKAVSRWPTVSLFPPRHPRRFLPALRLVLGTRTV